MVFGFIGLIAIGTLLLSLPVAREPGSQWSLTTSLFTAASAVCVTGLVVVDTGSYWSHFGQAVILGLIQLGGFGVMTASMFMLIVMRRPISLRDRFDVHEMARTIRTRTVASLIVITIAVTLLLEILGAVALGFRMGAFHAGSEAVWRMGFLAVSAFNNAGFDTSGGFASLTSYVRDPVFLLTIEALIVSGGLGMLVLVDVATKRSWVRLASNSKMVLLATLVLVTIGFVGILAAEFSNLQTLGAMAFPDKLSNAFFHSITARTAGFNTLSVGSFHDQTSLLTMLLMYIGGASGSTAGGIKVGTVVLLLLATKAGIEGYDTTSGFGRRFSQRLVYRALAVAFLAVCVIVVGTFILMIVDGFAFRRTLFEVVSAFGTVGLSTGITPELTTLGRLTIIVIMFVGRLGPLTLAYALAQKAKEPHYRLPEGEIPIG